MTISKTTYAIICKDKKKILIKPYAFLTLQEMFKTPSLIACEVALVTSSEHTVFWQWCVEEHTMTLNKFKPSADYDGKDNKVIMDIGYIVSCINNDDDAVYVINCTENSDVIVDNLKMFNIPHICINDAEYVDIKGDFVYVCEINRTTVIQDPPVHHCITIADGKVIGTRMLGLDIRRHGDAVLPKGILSSDGVTAKSEVSIWHELNFKLSMQYALDGDTTTNLLDLDNYAGV